MMKKFTLALAAVLGIFSASAAAVEDGHVYKVRNVDAGLYLHMTGSQANATIQAEDQATPIYFEAGSDEGQFLLRQDNAEGDILGVFEWNTVCNSTDTNMFWTVSEVEDATSEYPVVRFYQELGARGTTHFWGYMGLDGLTAGESTWSDKGLSAHTEWELIEVGEGEVDPNPTPDPETFGTQVTNATVETAFTDGAVITLQCLDTNGGAFYYFKGGDVKTEELGAANFFKVVYVDNGNFVLQSVENDTFVGAANAASNALVTDVEAIEEAMEFTGVAAVEASNWTTIATGVVNGENTIRFTTANNMYLNTNNTTVVPKWFGGAGGFSVWYVYTYTDEEVATYIPGYSSGSEPGEVIMAPAVTALVNGGTYYIYDSYNGANGDRVGFWGDRGISTEVGGPHESAEEAYNATNLGDNTILVTGTNHAHVVSSIAAAKWVWTAEQDETGMWAFKNASTGRYIGATNTPSTTPEYCSLEVFPGGDGDDYFRVTGSTNGKQFDANSDAGTTRLSWWQGSGHPMQFFMAVEDGTNGTGEAQYKFATENLNESYTVTVNFVCGEEIVATFTKSGKPGVTYTFKAPKFYTTEDGQPYTGVIGKANETINVPVTENLPFRASATVEGAEYQAIMIHSSYYNAADPFTFAYDEDEEELVSVRTAKAGLEPYTTAQMFAFIGTLKDGYKLYNQASEQYVKIGAVATLVEAEEATTFELRSSATNPDAQFYTLYAGNQYLNMNAATGVLSQWSAADQGSTMWTAGISAPIINYYTSFFNQAAAAFGEDPELMAAVEYAQAYLATLDAYTELTDEDLAPLAEIKEQLELMVQVVAKKNDLAKYFNASYLGAEAYEEETELLYLATTVEELDAAYEQLVGYAKEYFINSFADGAYLKNKRSGKYMGYTSQEDPNDDEIIITQYSKFVTPTLDCYFTAEAGEEGLYLYNPASKTYLGVQPGTEDDVVAPVETKAEAALYEVVAGTNGFEFLCTNSGVENNYINTDSYSGPLVVWNYANDGGAFWIAENLPMFDEYNTIEVSAAGVVADDKNTNLNTVSVVTTDEAQPTEFAVITVTDAEGAVVATATIAEGNDTGVYDITLAEPIAKNGVYTVKIAKAAFILDIDGDISYSPAASAEFTVDGAQDSISEITIAEGNANIFDLQGRRVIAPAHGLYIINGVKIVK